MAPGLPDRVDVARLAGDGAELERSYSLAEMPRLRDVLAQSGGQVHASFAFRKIEAGRLGATVRIEAAPVLRCQRCLENFDFPAVALSEIEFAEHDTAPVEDSERETYAMHAGSVSLRDLAEEELLLAIPFAPACEAPEACGRARREVVDAEPAEGRTRPFAGLQDMLKKTR